MLLRTAKLSTKGQITLPADALRAMKAGKGTEFVIIQEGERLVLVKAERTARQIVDDLEGWGALSAPAFNKIWSSKADEIWDES